MLEYKYLAVLGGTRGGSAQDRQQGVMPRKHTPKGLGKDSGSTASISTSWANRCQHGRHGHSGETPERMRRFEQ